MKTHLAPALTKRLVSNGDLAAWISPTRDNNITLVVMFSSGNQHYAVHADRNELTRLRDTIDNILDADTADIDNWLNEAADEIRSITAPRSHTAKHVAKHLHNGGTLKCN